MSEGPTLRLRMVRCSTLLLELCGVRLLTDPWFAMHLRGLPCLRRPGVRVDDLPPLDGLLVSHLHGDHFDLSAVRRLAPPPPRVLMPPGALAALGRDARPAWEELAPWTSTRIGPLEVWAVPGPHTLPRPDEINFVVRAEGWGTLFFGGDARLDTGVVAAVGERFGPFRVAFLPVGGTRILGRRTVMDPRDALVAADLLRAARIVPIHEGGIWLSVPPLSLHPGRAADLASACAERGRPERVVLLREGESAEL